MCDGFESKSAMTLLGSLASEFGFDTRSFASVWWKFKNGFHLLLARRSWLSRGLRKQASRKNCSGFQVSGFQIFTS
jgi:hypothetical protein